jgi:hypothetical protein
MSSAKTRTLKMNGKYSYRLVDQYFVMEPIPRSLARHMLLMQFILIIPPSGTSDDVSIEGVRDEYG